MPNQKRKKSKIKGLFRAKDGTYYGFIRPKTGDKQDKTGRVKEVSLKTKNYSEARELLEIKTLKLENSGYAGSELTYGQAIDDYLEEKKPSWKPRTYQTNKNIAKGPLLKFFDDVPLDKINHLAWSQFVKQTKNISDFMNPRMVLRNFLEFCVDKEWLSGMPRKFALPKHKRRPRRILTPNEIISLVKAAQEISGDIEIFIHLTLLHGLRGYEVTLSEFLHVRPDLRALMIPDTKTGIPRAVPLLDQTLWLLLEKQKTAKSRFIFPHRDYPNRPATNRWFKRGWERLLKKSGLGAEDITPHDLRATCEKYAALSKNFTKIQRIKMFGSDEEIQNRTYITELHVNEIRGLERAMLDTEMGVPGLESILISPRFEVGKRRDEELDEKDTKDLKP